MKLVDGDLIVRPPTASDAAEIAAAVRFSIEELLPWMVWASSDYDTADAETWAAKKLDPYPFVITSEAGEIIGTTGLNGLDEVNLRANLGYWLRSDQTGRGYATRATKLIARFGLEVVGLERIEVVMSVKNAPSRAVAERSGATYEGVARHRLRYNGEPHDAYMYSFIKADRV